MFGGLQRERTDVALRSVIVFVDVKRTIGSHVEHLARFQGPSVILPIFLVFSAFETAQELEALFVSDQNLAESVCFTE